MFRYDLTGNNDTSSSRDGQHHYHQQKQKSNESGRSKREDALSELFFFITRLRLHITFSTYSRITLFVAFTSLSFFLPSLILNDFNSSLFPFLFISLSLFFAFFLSKLYLFIYLSLCLSTVCLSIYLFSPNRCSLLLFN